MSGAELRPALRAPLLGFGLGALAGAGEALWLASSLKLALSFGQALSLALVAVGLDALLGLGLALPVGLLVELATRRVRPAHRHALSMAGTALLLVAWFLVPAARDLWAQGRVLAAVGFVLAPVGFGGVVYYNAAYWLRREEIGEEHRLGFRGWSLLVAVGLALLAAAVLSNRRFGQADAAADAPAVILVTIDTLRRDHVSAYWDDPALAPAATPVFDGLARQGGVLFTDAITPFPETAPAHSAMFTGLHPYRTGMLSNGHALSPGYATVAELLQDRGYATAAFVSSFAVDSRTGLDQGFEVYDDELFPWVRGFSEIRLARLGTRVLLRFGDPLKFDFLLERPAPVTFDLALRWLDGNRNKPFFLWVHAFDVHSPYEPHGLPGFQDNGPPGAPSIDHRWILANEQSYTYTDPARAKLRRLYAEEVAWTDARLGEFLAAVEAMALQREVLLIVTADHGEMLGEHAIEMNHHGVYDPAVRVPLVIRRMRATGEGKVVAEQVRLMDLPVTILRWLGVDAGESFRTEGVDLLGFVDHPEQEGVSTLVMGRRTASLAEGTLFGLRANARKELRTLGPDGQEQVQVQRGRVKYVLDPDAAREQLFDLVADPGEAVDLAAEQPQNLLRLRERVAQETGIQVTSEGGVLRFERSSQETQQGSQASEADLQMLRALGYVDE